ncbi:hypothetical protein [Streptomyces sp. NPDC058280]|uniref:hypothetical protein n=1 Tax=Streptomyces sp. NPDC058280 TaxID=3346419 RepID=UPI0036E97F92
MRSAQWMRRQTGHGTKGTREYDWAWLDVRPDDAPDGNENEAGTGMSVLVARRHRYTGEVSPSAAGRPAMFRSARWWK